MVNDIWSEVKVDFDEKLPRRTAVIVKDDDWGLTYAYPCDFGRIGYNIRTDSKYIIKGSPIYSFNGYIENPTISVSFAEYSIDNIDYSKLERSTSYFENMTAFPSAIDRNIVFSNMGLEAKEHFCQGVNGGYVWDFGCISKCLNHKPYSRSIYTIISFISPVEITKSDSNAIKIVGDFATVYMNADFQDASLFTSISHFTDSLEEWGEISQGKTLILKTDINLLYEQKKNIRFAFSFVSAEQSQSAYENRSEISHTKEKWNNWFSTLPDFGFKDDARKAYYKCWWTARDNYYKDEKMGDTVLEALPVYRGFWQWGTTGMEIISHYNPEIGPKNTKNTIDLFLDNQREDGFVTHAIYINEEVPGEIWSKINIIQTPHLPWIAMKYYNQTKDKDSIAKWYPKFKKYYDYLCESRDVSFKNLHLWAAFNSFDTGLDTTSAFQKATYGEDGVTENYIYPAIFAAERARYEQAMAKMASIIGCDEAAMWLCECDLTIDAMNNNLWDSSKNWYGVIHEDGTLDTRIGVDGLFPFAYKLVDETKAKFAKDSFKKLIAKYGVHTVTPDELGFCNETYWRGPVWPKSISMAAAGAVNYYPEFISDIQSGLINFAMKYPSIWECMDAQTGKIARGDMGMMATPIVASNVGAGELIGALLMLNGEDTLAF